MLHDTVSGLFRRFGRPAFRIYGRASYEPDWHVIDVFTSRRRNWDSSWPFFRRSCTTWTANVIAVGWDFAEDILTDQAREPATRDRPAIVRGGQLRFAWTEEYGSPRASEVLAHECGHTGQARRMGFWYWPVGAALTRFREGSHWWNCFENEASATGQFGGIVEGTVDNLLYLHE